ncbi:MAG: hydroxymethylbilane synthase [Desulfovibrionaceae bacterium]|nr:hydroxymethylbilane synthase [Desulfovibrionaceae bacterium]
MKKTVTIATRGSSLALWQAEHVKARLLALHSGLEVVINIIKTRGDVIQDVPLAKVGGKGLFVKEIEEALLSGAADLAVHSMKDVPMLLPEGLTLGCVPQREVCTDSLLSTHFPTLDDLPRGARVGTSSLRRQAQLLALRPDLRISWLRGNVDTRLRKLSEGQYDAIVLASAGLKRLGLSAPHMFELAPPAFVPAVGQGALGIECAAGRQDILDLLAPLEHRETRVCVEAERAFLRRLDGGCQVPIAGHAVMKDADTVLLDGLVGETDGSRIFRRHDEAPAAHAEACGAAMAEALLADGASDVLARLYAEEQARP